MATSEFWQRVSASSSAPDWTEAANGQSSRKVRGQSKIWMIADATTVVIAVTAAALFEVGATPLAGVKMFWRGTLIHGASTGILLTLLSGFILSLILTSRRLHLYSPTRVSGFLHEQRLNLQACFTSGLLLTGALYLTHTVDVPRSIVAMTLGLVTVSLALRRLLYRIIMHRRFERGLDTRNVLIVGTGPEAHALRHHLETARHLGYTFKGFVGPKGSDARIPSISRDVVGNIESLFQHARKHFIDEIFFTSPSDRGVVAEVLEKARVHGVDLRVLPDMYDGLAWNSPIEYIGQFPTIPLHRGHIPELELVLKRLLDIALSSFALVMLSPILCAIAIAIRFDSPGPIFYSSERIGKKGRVFRCIKFRTMVRDAETMRAEIMHMNERNGILFKITNDPRITKLGRILRKYSLDELPQFLNVLHGDMSVVGPRPPIASEVREYKLNHLRRLDVTPGITGLWQVQGRRDPSFDSYISLDLAYIENWSVWLDVKIIMRTIGVVFAGTGS